MTWTSVTRKQDSDGFLQGSGFLSGEGFLVQDGYWTNRDKFSDTWTDVTRASSGSQGYGIGPWGSEPWGSPSGASIWTNVTKAT